MTQYFLYLLESGICLSLFYLIYWLLIKDDTFHKLKRYFLLLSVVISLIIPVLPQTNLTKAIEKNILPGRTENVTYAASHDNFEKLVLSDILIQAAFKTVEKKPVNFLSIVIYIYIMGAGFMFFRLINNFYQILNTAGRSKREPYGNYTIVILSDDYPTFSFFRFIFFNGGNLSANEKNDVLLHELTHIKQWHSLDIIFIEICKILFWFFPIIWYYKTSLSKVHECLADEFLVEFKTGNIQDYQSLLLYQYISNIKIELANPFNYSLIKYRINMMTKTKSKWWAKFKLLFSLPIIILSLVAFTNDKLSSPIRENSLQKQLNQIELFKKFIGTWRYEVNKDTIFTMECNSNDDGLNIYLKGEANGKIMMEQKGVMEYDSKADRMIQLNPIDNLNPIAMWFTSDNLCEVGQIPKSSNLSKIMTERKWEFKSSDLLVLTILIDGKYVDALVLKRKIN